MRLKLNLSFLKSFPGRIEILKNVLIVRYQHCTNKAFWNLEKWVRMVLSIKPGLEKLGRRKWQPTPVSLPGESHGQRSLGGYSPDSHRVRHDWSDWAQHREVRVRSAWIMWQDSGDYPQLYLWHLTHIQAKIFMFYIMNKRWGQLSSLGL